MLRQRVVAQAVYHSIRSIAARTAAFSSAVPQQPGSGSLTQSQSQSQSASDAPRIPVLKTVQEMRQLRKSLLYDHRTVGVVPTMGALHAGHLELVKAALEKCHTVITTIFVNPTQFAPHEDFDRYPRDLAGDVAKLETVRGNRPLYVFAPSREEMYPPQPPHATFVDIVGINDTAEGKSRPGFFRGVATVVSKLFNVTQPHQAFFGQKDGMQCLVLKRMVRELNFPVQLVICPTMREPDHLAMSSRNVYLSPAERKAAPVIYASLMAAQRLFDGGERSVQVLEQAVRQGLQSEPLVHTVHYVDTADLETGASISGSGVIEQVPRGGGPMLSVAVTIGKTRLIDNILLTPA